MKCATPPTPPDGLIIDGDPTLGDIVIARCLENGAVEIRAYYLSDLGTDSGGPEWVSDPECGIDLDSDAIKKLIDLVIDGPRSTP